MAPQDGSDSDEMNADSSVVDLAGRGSGQRFPQSVMIALPPHLSFLIHRDSAREGTSFAEYLNGMLIEYLEAYYEDDLVALDAEQLKLFGLDHLDIGARKKPE